MTDPSNAGIIQVGEERWIPESQRADGSYRKERKVRPGFVPLEDVKRYSNARIEQANAPKLPPGYKPSSKAEIRGGKKKEPVKTPAATKKKETTISATASTTTRATEQTTEKKIKALNKKVRQIAELEQKLIKGETLNEEQHDKVKKGKSLREELAKLSLE